LIKEIVKLNNDMKIKCDETKMIIFSDPVEKIFQDERLYAVRMALDHMVFKTFIKNYTEAFCHIVVEDPQERYLNKGNFDVCDKRTDERLKIGSWRCPCKDENKTGLPCIHVLSGARRTDNFDYLSLVRRRWKSENVQQRIFSF